MTVDLTPYNWVPQNNSARYCAVTSQFVVAQNFEHSGTLSTSSTVFSSRCSTSLLRVNSSTAQRKALPEDAPTYVVLAFTLVMKRKMVFSTYILTLPCIFLATLTLLVFWLPPSRPDRTSLGESLAAVHGAETSILPSQQTRRIISHLLDAINLFLTKGDKVLAATALTVDMHCVISAMSIFGSFLVLLLILVEAAPPTASSVPRLGELKL